MLPPPGTEATDRRSLDSRVAEVTLRDIAVANRWFGGRAAVLFGVRRLLAGASRGGCYRVLDLGAGMGDITRWLAERLGSAGYRVQPVALDHHRAAARLCRAAGVPAVVADLAALPCGAGVVDVVVLSQVLHHLPRPDVVALARVVTRIARWGVVVADLRRSPAAAAGVWLASFPLGFHPVTRADGIVSVRRGFTASELAGLLAQARLDARVYRRWGSRLVALWRTPHAHR